MHINVLGRAPWIVTDFGIGHVLEGEDERSAAIRMYHEWCRGDNPPMEPDPNPTVLVHDAR